MKDWKNPELRLELLLYGLMVPVFGALGLLVSPWAGLLGACAALAGGVLHWSFVHRRYRELAALSQSLDRVLHGQDQLLEEIWDAAGDYVNDNTLTVYIKRLREKLEDDPQQPALIKTVRGIGYRVDE